MILGDKQSFAVELELDEDYGGAWLYGKFCYWINGVQVGDYELGTSLRDVLSGMKWVVHDCGNRDGAVLCKGIPQEAFSKLNSSLYESDEIATHTDCELPETPARFEITVPVDVFDGWKAFLIECGGQARILYKNSDDTDIKVAAIPAGLFDDVIRQAYTHLDSLHEREST